VNGHAQLTFLTMLAERAGHPIDVECMNPEDILKRQLRVLTELLVMVIRNLLHAGTWW